ncbi:MAG TPA: hypothetical protein VFW50_02300, partial [Streptosporangiaceae bacterium]|nr:hypothetical protein [Streptosporangiaceae bacterium]
MRYRLMATYLGVPYYVGLGPDGNEATLFSPAPPPDELGFAPAGGLWRKQVSLPDLDALWQSRLTGDYRGEPCLVLDDLGDRLHIAYQGRDSARARQLGYWEIDREVFEVVVARSDVTGLIEDQVNFPLSSAVFPPSNRDPGTPARPEAHGRGRQAPGGMSSAGPSMPPAAERTSPLRVVPRPGPQPAPVPEPAARPPGGYREAAGQREPAGLPEPGGYAEADRARRTPDRAAAWHGSPETEPWSESLPPPPPRPEPRSEPRLDPRSDPRSAPRPEPRREFRAGPWPRPEARSEARPEARSEPRLAGGGPEPRPMPPAPSPTPPSGRRSGRRDRVPQSVFGELLSLAAIPHSAYAVDEEVPGAMCLVKADGGFEVFSRTDDARLDVRFFEDEEAAYFYLFGVLAAEAVRSGRLQ